MELITATFETLEMTGIALLCAYLIGLPLGVISNETDKSKKWFNKAIHFICQIIIGTGRAIPFTILMVLALPLTRLLVGTGVGTAATIVPLTLATVPFVAKIVEQSLDQVTQDIIEAACIDGASKIKLIFKIKIGSRLFDLINSCGITSVAIVSYTAIAGMLGGGGLGNYAITKGYYHYEWLKVLYATLIIVAIVCFLQWLFKFLSKLVDWRKAK